MSGPCLSSSVAGHPLRPATRRRLGGPLPRQLADRPRTHPEAAPCSTFGSRLMPACATLGINPSFPGLSPSSGQIVHVLRTRPPLNSIAAAPFDLHVLSTPPAFVLSQNQTLRRKCSKHDSGITGSHAQKKYLTFGNFSPPQSSFPDRAESSVAGPRAFPARSAQISLFFPLPVFPADFSPVRRPLRCRVFPAAGMPSGLNHLRFLPEVKMNYTAKNESFRGTKNPVVIVSVTIGSDDSC